MKNNSSLSFVKKIKVTALFLSTCLVMACTFVFSGTATAQEYVSIDIRPPHVGVFVGVPQQQFTAYGVTASGQKVNITDQVDWYLDEYPFSQQTMEPDEIAVIDKTGYLTINTGVTWGRVSVTACYPKGCGIGLTSYGGSITSSLSILLVPKFIVSTSTLTDGTLASSGGSITPSDEQKVKKGKTASFTVTANTGYRPSVSGCSGNLVGNIYTTGPVTADCIVSADFKTANTTLTVITTTGTGTGTVTSSPAGIDCGSTCDSNFIENEVVTLTATPTADSTFVAWDAAGDCSACTTSTTCDVTMDAAKSCTAKFDIKPTWALSVIIDGAGTGTGAVTAPAGTPTGVGNDGIDCGGSGDCTDAYFEGDVVTLTAAPTADSTFVAWDAASDCSACTTSTTCDVTMDAAKSCTAKFDLTPTQYALTIDGVTTTNQNADVIGGVVDSTVTISCVIDASVNSCSDTKNFSSGTVVTLQADALTGQFVSWSGDCLSCGINASCDITMDSIKSCTATFGP